MKIFKVSVKMETMKVVKSPSDYYDVDGKICFKVKIFEEHSDYKVKAWTLDAVRTFFKQYEVIAAYYVEDSENTWNKIAPADYVSIESSEQTSRTFLRFSDQQCSPEVQDEYSKDPEAYMNKPKIYSEF